MTERDTSVVIMWKQRSFCCACIATLAVLIMYYRLTPEADSVGRPSHQLAETIKQKQLRMLFLHPEPS